MPDDRELARHALRLQQEASDCPMRRVPGYMAWSKRKLQEGESSALIAHLDATSLWLLPEELAVVSEEDFSRSGLLSPTRAVPREAWIFA